MDDQNSWKGHSFTLMIFGGIVMLCAIFFVLGMLVGHTQGLKLATVAAATPPDTSPAKALEEVPKDEHPDLTFYDAVEKKRQPPLVRAPDPPAVKVDPAPPKASPVATGFNFQVSALTKQADAEKMVKDLKKKGFHAFMLTPQQGDPNPLYRVQVGPFTDPFDAESAKQKLEALGYKPIKK
jgi:cell division septation protein DedD